MKRVLSIIVTLIICLSVFPLTSFAEDVAAAEQSWTWINLNNTTIEDDFSDDIQNIGVFNGKYKLKDYKEKMNTIFTEGEIQFIDVMESRLPSGETEIFIYVYNPHRKKMVLDSEFNTLNMARIFENEHPDYAKLKLEFVSSYGAKDENLKTTDALVTKWKVAQTFETIAEGPRVYGLADFEIITEGELLPDYYMISQKVRFDQDSSGYHTIAKEDLVSLELEANHTYYRFNTKGVGSYTDLRSVYFAVPNWYLDIYGELTQIKAEWNYFETGGILVSNKVDIPSKFKPALGMTPEELGDWFGYAILMDKFERNAAWELAYDHYNYTYNPAAIKQFQWGCDLGEEYLVQYDFPVKPEGTNWHILAPQTFNGNITLSWVIHDKNASKEDMLIKSPDEVLEYYEKYCTDYINGDKNNYVRYIGSTEKTFNIEHEQSVNEYILKASGWDKLLGKIGESNIDRETFSNIVKVDRSKVLNMKDNPSDLCEYYYIDETEVDKFIEKVSDEEYNDYTWYILRYETTAYQDYDALIVSSEGSADLGEAFVSTLGIIHDFDTIEVGLGGTATEPEYIVPVGSAPSSAAVGIYTPAHKPSIDDWLDDIQSWWEKLLSKLEKVLAVIFVLVLVALVIKVFQLFKRNKTKVVIKQNKGDKK